MKKTLLAGSITALLFSCTTEQKEMTDTIAFTPPTTETCDSVDVYFGDTVPDPYQWLEDDYSKKTNAWVSKQSKATEAYLAQIPQRENIRKRLTQVWNYEKYSVPFRKKGATYLFKNDGIQNQSVLYQVADDGTEELVLDPNTFSEDGTVALGSVALSKNGKLLGYSTSKSGSDWNTIQVMDLESKTLLEDSVPWVKFSGIAWQGNGFYYSGYSAPKKGEEYSQKNEFHKIKYHTLGASYTDDIIVAEDKEHAQRNFYASTSENEEYVLIYSSESTSGNAFGICTSPQEPITWFDTSFNYEHSFVGINAGKLLYLTNDNAPTYKLIAINPQAPEKENWETVIPASEHLLESVTMANGKLLVKYLQDVANKLYVYSLNGVQETEVKLPGIGQVAGINAYNNLNTAFFAFTNFTTPTSICMLDLENNETSIYKAPEVDFNTDNFITEQVKYTSKDGTQVPMFITYKKGLKKTGETPCFLYAYGGFNISIKPSFSVSYLPFLEAGGIYAVANIRGGGEYGEAWHEAGTKQQKQNVFDDFIAAGEYLIKEKYTSANKLAVHGRSNGGLLVGAVLTQRPDLMKVALPQVGVLDMLKYHQFTIGWAWAADYGRSDDNKEMYDYLKGYSPLHNVKETAYPATMVITGDHDDRVVPAHSFKFGAALQAKQQGKQPILVRIDINAGHGSGKPVSKQIAELTDEWAFVYHHLGVK